MVGVGATVMYFIGKRLKKRHGISKDVREDMYLACKTWTKELKKNNTPFMGGSTPNLADLAFFGALTCMEGCRTFDDIRSNTDLGKLKLFATSDYVTNIDEPFLSFQTLGSNQ